MLAALSLMPFSTAYISPSLPLFNTRPQHVMTAAEDLTVYSRVEPTASRLTTNEYKLTNVGIHSND